MALADDVRCAIRTFARDRLFTIVVCATLAIAIGANAAVFAICNAVLFAGIPLENGDRLAYLSLRRADRGDQVIGLSYPDYLEWRERTTAFEGLAAFVPGQLNLGDDTAVAETYPTSQQTANGFALVGQQPFIGRDFTASDEQPGAAAVLILSHGLWQRRYGGDPSVVGRHVRVNGTPATIIGVMPEGFAFPFNADLWTMLPATATSGKRDANVLHVYGPMRQGITLAEARAEIAALWTGQQQTYAATNAHLTLSVQTYHEAILGTYTPMFVSMLVAVAFLLLIACANVANLQFASALRRSRDVAIRLAMGATRVQIIRQLLTESLLLAIVGGLFGWMLAVWGSRAFDVAVTPLGKPRWMESAVDGRVLAYLAILTLATGLLFGLAAALGVSGPQVSRTLKDSRWGASRSSRRWMSVLVVSELALATVLLAGAGVMVRSVLNVYNAPLGVNSDRVLTMRVVLPAARYPGPDQRIAFHDRLQMQVSGLPGVASVAVASNLPTAGSTPLPYEVEGAEQMPAAQRPSVSLVVAGHDYFKVWEVSPASGRVFTADDLFTSQRVAVVNQAFADRAWKGADPIGKRLRLFAAGAPEDWLMVVGVVPNIVQNEIIPTKADPLIYLPYRQRPAAATMVIARTTVPPETLALPIRQQVQRLDAELPVLNLMTMNERLQRNYGFSAVIAGLFGVFAMIALILAGVGLYAVVGYTVEQRRAEIGIRLALGATRGAVIGQLFMLGVRQVALGLAIGLAAAAVLTRGLTAVLIGVPSMDPLSFATGAAILAAVGVMASIVPARRSARVDPVVALRTE